MAYLSSLSWLPQFTTVRRTREASGYDFWRSLTGNGIYICTLSKAWGISLWFVLLLWSLGIWHHAYLAAAVLGPYRNHGNTLLFQIQKCSVLFRSTSISSVLYVFGVEAEKGLSMVIPDLMLVVGSSPGCFSLNSELPEFRVKSLDDKGLTCPIRDRSEREGNSLLQESAVWHPKPFPRLFFPLKWFLSNENLCFSFCKLKFYLALWGGVRSPFNCLCCFIPVVRVSSQGSEGLIKPFAFLSLYVQWCGYRHSVTVPTVMKTTEMTYQPAQCPWLAMEP